jgi:hypothetical protein
MGYEGVYQRITPQRSWTSLDNQVPAVTLVPAFLDPSSPRKSWYVRFHGMDYDVAATHFVGISGIGLDAAEYSATDPSTAKKLGVFGYDRLTRLADITDGLANTIMVAQVPHAYMGAWIAGGGSTVRGVPESKSVQPFVATQYDGKRGTMAIMADGSVRFITETVSDDVFKALCTIKGGEKVDVNKVAPLVPAPQDASLDTADLVAVPKQREVEDSAEPAKKPESKQEMVLAGWKEYTYPRSADGQFAIMLPEPPTIVLQQNLNVKVGGLNGHTFKSSQANGNAFTVFWVDSPLLKNSRVSQNFLTEARNGYLAVTKGELINGHPFSFGRFSALEFTVKLQNGVLELSRIYLIGERVYHLTAQPMDKVTADEARMFFDSFRILP